MDPNRKHQVSLRGASAKEISRDALIEKVSQERELRNYARRANAASIFIQRVWRGYSETKRAALNIRDEWETLLYDDDILLTGTFISNYVVRPFIYFVSCLSTRHHKIEARDMDCMKKCFEILLESINSTDPNKNYCCLALGTTEERAAWIGQAKNLIITCSFILAECDSSRWGQNVFIVTSLAMRFVVLLTDLKGWKSVTDHNIQDASLAVKTLVCFMGSRGSGLYLAIRKYISTLDVTYFSQVKNLTTADEKFLITASAVTLALRPIHASNIDFFDPAPMEMNCAAEQYSLFLLTVPCLLQRLPAVLITALNHKSIISPCFHTLLISRDRILAQMSEMDKFTMHFSSKRLPSVGWAVANIINLATCGGNDLSLESSEYPCYVHVVITLAEYFLAWLENIGWLRKEHDVLHDVETFKEPIEESPAPEMSLIMQEYLKMPYTDLLKPVCQQWHLTKLLSFLRPDTSSFEADTQPLQNMRCTWKLELKDIAYFYSYILRIFSALNPMVGSLPALNMLSFTPGFLITLWGVLELSLFPRVRESTIDDKLCSNKVSENSTDRVLQKNQKQANKDGANKWVSVLHKFTGKSQAGNDSAEAINHHLPIDNDEDSHDTWDVEPLRCGPQGLSKDTSCLLHLFCATYAHLLLVLDDTEFYEKQVPFTLEQQQRIASALNTLVYNGLSHSGLQRNRYLMDSAIRCLHLIYERDCRHQFCPSGLWLSPGRKSRPPIAVAARYHESYSGTSLPNDSTIGPGMSSVITATPHIFPFEERVQMFRELVKMDKMSRKMAGEVTGPGSRSVEIVIRRSHIVEDGFRQLNSLGSRLKSSIHVSFVSECGLSEAGLDYGGLSKEFLTDISKTAFSPEYGLFSQTSTSDRHLMPNACAMYVDNGIQMIEFLGRVVGKALYEGILLDYSFAHAFVQKLLGRYSFLDELSTLDPELYKNLVYVKHYDGDVEDLALDFTVTEESFGERHVIELKSGGKEISVTNENKLHYIHAVADYKLNRQILAFSNAFYRGLSDLISPSWLRIFNANEFNQLLSGGRQDIDVEDLKNNTQYTGGYSEGSRTIKLFWEVMRAFEPNDRCLLLKFVTSCSRAPLLGFKYLQPAFTIHKVACDVPFWATIGGQDAERLPSASTCYNTLKLPTYKRASTLREKIIYAISSNAGFELS